MENGSCNKMGIKDIYLNDIFIQKINSEVKCRRPIGFLCNIGAPKSVIGRKELNIILGIHDKKTCPSFNRFRFADAAYDFLG